MTTSLRYPPTLSSLLEHEDYSTYFRRTVKLLPTISPNPRWMIMAETHEGKWKRAMRHTFKEGLVTVNRILADTEHYRDLSIISRSKLFKEPSFAHELMSPGEQWCGRCRRPSIFTLYGSTHPALRDVPVIVEGERRCYFCGIREEMSTSWKLAK